ncbi:hypothetical protein BMS3Bbin06_00448 [bacterium BMS3Bbin06]|nr:hypothetical protein BMS3Abin08_02160 [bacterium BMS3Abin08]GBE33932.1 hypothetical protein BMS3Bbin06_00448 [bacterium BMS3Bbin06]HDO35934.1 isoprenylcysteine carboxylmethyltransferase family protein [Nitrospirota bacterium]HDY72013.1 isoprenylcysteine carboxylmethyltransferase family protein [Nitrospirota bacterium]
MEVLRIIGAFLVFAFLHSLCVRERVKLAVADLLGEEFVRGCYRFLYTVFSVVIVTLSFRYIHSLEDLVLYKGPPLFRWSMHIIQFGGLIFGVMTFRVIDGMEFTGLRQVSAFLRKRPVLGDIEGIRGTLLIQDGTYGIVRHPLYLAGIIIFTFEPDITRNGLTVTVLADLYFLFGILTEERRFIKRFGEEYLRYMKRVPRFIPWPGKK